MLYGNIHNRFNENVCTQSHLSQIFQLPSSHIPHALSAVTQLQT